MTVKVEYSNGKGKSGKNYAFIRPSGKCSNRSRRVEASKVKQAIDEHFPNVNYYEIGGLVIGAKNPEFAVKEFYRVCEKQSVNKPFEPVLLNK